jgi:NAD(P)-dependent dehydrogenase (short-subunit alcohol dehydrogenase family)
MDKKRKYSNNGRVVVVRGPSKGIGKAIAMEFAKAGYFCCNYC